VENFKRRIMFQNGLGHLWIATMANITRTCDSIKKYIDKPVIY